MNIFKSILTILILFCFITDTNAGDIVGKVKYDGKPPKKRPLRMDADPVCGSSHSGKVFSESFKGFEYKVSANQCGNNRKANLGYKFEDITQFRTPVQWIILLYAYLTNQFN